MTSTYPSFIPDPNDRNRRTSVELPADGSWPVQLRWGFVLILVGAVLMLLTALLQLTGGYPGDPDADYDVINYFMRNLRFTAYGNILAAVILTVLATRLRSGNKVARRWITGVIVLVCALNIVSYLLGIAGFGSVLIMVLLILALLMIFRPSSNAFIDREWAARKNA